jgi:hypothetical protein
MKNHILTDQHVLRAQSRIRKFFPQDLNYAAFEGQLTQISLRYRENIKAIITLAKSREIPIFLIKQPMTTTHNRYSSFSYEEEYRAILARFNEKSISHQTSFSSLNSTI